MPDLSGSCFYFLDVKVDVTAWVLCKQVFGIQIFIGISVFGNIWRCGIGQKKKLSGDASEASANLWVTPGALGVYQSCSFLFPMVQPLYFPFVKWVEVAFPGTHDLGEVISAATIDPEVADSWRMFSDSTLYSWALNRSLKKKLASVSLCLTKGTWDQYLNKSCSKTTSLVTGLFQSSFLAYLSNSFLIQSL